MITARPASNAAPDGWAHRLLPQQAQRALRAAAAIEPVMPPGFSNMRTVYLDRVIRRVRADYAKFFRENCRFR